MGKNLQTHTNVYVRDYLQISEYKIVVFHVLGDSLV
jgi:hypothetical protein